MASFNFLEGNEGNSRSYQDDVAGFSWVDF